MITLTYIDLVEALVEAVDGFLAATPCTTMMPLLQSRAVSHIEYGDTPQGERNPDNREGAARSARPK